MRNYLRLVFLIVLSCAVPAEAGSKKGIGIGTKVPSAADRIARLGVGWYYTWNFRSVEGVDASFVPMFWSATVGDIYSRGRARKWCYLLGFNEPDSATQANMSVSAALAIWPKLRSRAKVVGSPATVNPLNSWMNEFSVRSEAFGGYDFIAMHWYGAPNPREFLKRVDDVYAFYVKPIWITEFAVADWSAKRSGKNRFDSDQVLNFMKIVLPELEKRDYVHRYAWFGAYNYGVATNSSELFLDNGSFTEVGRFYAGFKSAPAGGEHQQLDCR